MSEELFARITDHADAYKHANENLLESTIAFEEAQLLHSSATEAHEAMGFVGKMIQYKAFQRIERIVSECLRTIFGPDAYDVKLIQTERAGKSNLSFEFIRDGEAIDAMDAAGGGVVDVASFALRVAALMMSKPQERLVLILDEPFRFVSAEFRENVSQLLYLLAERFGLQIIVVTHIEDLEIGDVHRIS